MAIAAMPFLFCLPGPAAQRAQDGSPIRRAKNARRRAAPPSSRRPRRREKVWPATRRVMPQADRGPPKRAPYGSHTAPVPAAKYSCWPRAATHRPAGRAAAKSPAKHPTGCAPSQNTRPRPYGRGRVSRWSVSFLPLKQAAAHNRKNRAAKNAWASRHAGRTAPPRHENSPVSRTPRAATHRPACRAAAKNPAGRA